MKYPYTNPFTCAETCLKGEPGKQWPETSASKMPVIFNWEHPTKTLADIEAFLWENKADSFVVTHAEPNNKGVFVLVAVRSGGYMPSDVQFPREEPWKQLVTFTESLPMVWDGFIHAVRRRIPEEVPLSSIELRMSYEHPDDYYRIENGIYWLQVRRADPWTL